MIRSGRSPIFGTSTTPTTTFDDDEPLPTTQPPPHPPPLHPSSTPPSAAATIKTFTEYPAIAASASPSDFAVLIKVHAPPAPPSRDDRVPIDLVAVLDISGSMDGNKLALLKRAVHFIIDTLGPTDRLSIVTFANNARRVLPLSCMSDAGRAGASAAVDSLTARGSTNIKDGLVTGVRVLQQCRHRNPVAGLILLSDGQDNCSIRRVPEPGVDDLFYSNLLPSHRVTTHTFGFGADHDPRAMHAIADATGGTFSFIEVEADVQDAFAMCIGGLLSVAAQKMEIMVSSASSGVLIASVASGSYSSKVLNYGLAAVIELGDLYADEEKDFLVHVSVPVSSAHMMPLVTVNCSYKDPHNQEVINVEGEATVIRRPDYLSPEDEAVSLIVDGQRNRILVAESIREAQARAEREDLDGAKAVLASRRLSLVASASAKSGDELCRWLDAELQEIQNRMANMGIYQSSGRAYTLSGMSSHMQQRSAAGAWANGANKFAMVTNAGPSFRSGEVVDGTAQQQQSAVLFGLRRSTGGNIGYQTKAMHEMVEKSQNYARRNPLPGEQQDEPKH